MASAALANLPDQASSPTKILYLSSKTSIAIEWNLNIDHQLPGGVVTGYKVQVDDGLNGDFSDIFYGKNVPSLHQYILKNLVAQRGYRFRIQAENFNGFGLFSNIVTYYTCLPPSQLDPVQKVYSTATSMVVNWTSPADDGGCPITGYALYRDDGITEIPLIEVNTGNDPLVRNIPTLRQVTAQLTSVSLGSWITYQVQTFNSEGTVSSQTVKLLFAIPPAQPSAGPVV